MSCQYFYRIARKKTSFRVGEIRRMRNTQAKHQGASL